MENRYIFVAMRLKLNDSFLLYPKEYIEKVKLMWYLTQKTTLIWILILSVDEPAIYFMTPEKVLMKPAQLTIQTPVD